MRTIKDGYGNTLVLVTIQGVDMWITPQEFGDL